MANPSLWIWEISLTSLVHYFILCVPNLERLLNFTICSHKFPAVIHADNNIENLVNIYIINKAHYYWIFKPLISIPLIGILLYSTTGKWVRTYMKTESFPLLPWCLWQKIRKLKYVCQYNFMNVFIIELYA